MWVMFYGVPIRVGHSGERVYRLSSSSIPRLERLPVSGPTGSPASGRSGPRSFPRSRIS